MIPGASKYLIGFILFCVVFVPISLEISTSQRIIDIRINLKQNEAEAFIPVADIVTFEIKFIFDVLIEYLKLKLLDIIINQIVSWINGVQQGMPPQFVMNWEGFLARQGRQATDILISEIDKAFFGGLLCSPFADRLRMLFRININLSIPTFQGQITCTLDQILSNINQIRNLFSNPRGWAGYLSITTNPNNNYYGAMITVMDTQVLVGTSKQRGAENDAKSGSGYLGIKRCVEADELTGDCLEHEITGPGQLLAEGINRSIGNRIDFVVNTQQWASMIAVLVDNFTNKLVETGADGLLGYETPSGSFFISSDNIGSFGIPPPPNISYPGNSNNGGGGLGGGGGGLF